MLEKAQRVKGFHKTGLPLVVAHCCKHVGLLHIRPGVAWVRLQGCQAIRQRVHVPTNGTQGMRLCAYDLKLGQRAS